jgi:hypothetical protein
MRVLLLLQGKGAEPTGKEKNEDSPKLNIDVAKDRVVGDEEKETQKQAQ